MNRFKLVCIGIALILIICAFSSCVRVPAGSSMFPSQSSKFSIQRVYIDSPMCIYEVTTPKGTVYVARNGQGLCTLN